MSHDHVVRNRAIDLMFGDPKLTVKQVQKRIPLPEQTLRNWYRHELRVRELETGVTPLRDQNIDQYNGTEHNFDGSCTVEMPQNSIAPAGKRRGRPRNTDNILPVPNGDSCITIQKELFELLVRLGQVNLVSLLRTNDLSGG